MAWYKCTRDNQFDGITVYVAGRFYEFRTVTPPAAFFTLDSSGDEANRRKDVGLPIQKSDDGYRNIEELIRFLRPVEFEVDTTFSSIITDLIRAESASGIALANSAGTTCMTVGPSGNTVRFASLTNGNRVLVSGASGLLAESDVDYQSGVFSRATSLTVGRSGEGYTDAFIVQGRRTGDSLRSLSIAISSTTDNEAVISGVSKISIPSLQFDLNPSMVSVEGSMYWDPTDGTINVGMPGGRVSLQLGQELYLPRRVLNDSGSDMANGQLVYISGGTGNNVSVMLAQADNETSAQGTIAMLTEDIDDNSSGYATTFGLVRGDADQPIDTSSWTPGTRLYLSDSVAGGFTNAKPAVGNYCVCIGQVFRQHATEGSIIVHIRVSPKVGDLSDASITSVTDNELFSYDSASGTWINQTALELGLVSGSLTNVGRMVRVSAAGTIGETDISVGAADGIISRASGITLSHTKDTYFTNLGIGLGATPTGALDIVDANATSWILHSTNALNDTAKTGRYGMRHYSNSEEPFSLITGSSNSANNTVNFGGGVAVMNAATLITFYTTANITTVTGTERARINSSGQVLIGTTSAVGSELARFNGGTANSPAAGASDVLVGGGEVSAGKGVAVAGKIREWYDSSTGEYGKQIKVLNKTGGASIKGYLLCASASTDLGVEYTVVNDPDPIFVVYEAGVADGSEMWVWMSGLVQIYCGNAASREYVVRATATGDADTTAGRATAEAAPTSPFATDKHFQEIAHVAKAGAAGLVLCWMNHAN